MLVAIATFDGFNSFAEEVEALTEDEIEGMYAQFPEDAPDPSGDGSIPNYVVEKYTMVTHKVIKEGAGPGAIAGSIGTIVGKIAGGTKGSTATSAAVRGIRSGRRKGPSSIAKKAGSKSSTIQKIFKDKRMLDCVFTGASLAGASKSKREDKVIISQHHYYIEIDWRRTAEISPEGVAITLNYSHLEDALESKADTTNDPYYRRNGILYEACNRAPINNLIVSLKVDGGCCAFYDGANCESDTHLFDMYNREHQDSRGDHRGAISSYWCTESEHYPGEP